MNPQIISPRPESSVHRGRVLKGKHLKPLQNYFGNPERFDPNEGCLYDEAFDEVAEALAPVFSDFMSKQDVWSILYQSVSEFEDNVVGGGEVVSTPEQGAERRAALIAHIVNFFSQYPKNYTVRVALPLFRRLPPAEIALSDKVTLSFVEAPERTPSAFLSLSISGYCDGNINGYALSECFKTIKLFTFGLCRIKLSFPRLWGGRTEATIQEEGGRVIPLPLPNGLSLLIGSLTLNLGGLINLSGGRIKNVSDLGLGLEELAKAFQKYFRVLSQGEGERLSAAIDWLEESNYSENQTVAYLMVCIGLEAILAEESHMTDMSNRLCDRLAYTLGKNQSERKKIFEQYKNILGTRGRLVHSKQQRLGDVELKLLEEARILLRRLIEHEINFHDPLDDLGHS